MLQPVSNNLYFPVSETVYPHMPVTPGNGFAVTTTRIAGSGELVFRVAARGPYSYLSTYDVFKITNTKFSACTTPAMIL